MSTFNKLSCVLSPFVQDFTLKEAKLSFVFSVMQSSKTCARALMQFEGEELALGGSYKELGIELL